VGINGYGAIVDVPVPPFPPLEAPWEEARPDLLFCYLALSEYIQAENLIFIKHSEHKNSFSLNPKEI
jgi:hypothetical protein